MRPDFGAIPMLVVYAVVCAVLAGWGFIFLHEIGHRDRMPAFFQKWAGFEIIIPLLIGCMVFTFVFPILFFLDYAEHSFGWAEGGLALAVAAAGVLGVWGFLTLQRRRDPVAGTQDDGKPRVVASNPAAPQQGNPGPEPRPLKPAGGARGRPRKAA